MKASEKYQLIEKTVRAHQLKGQIGHLCTVGKVSKSGYYAWLRSESARQIREESDEQEVQLIKEIFRLKKEKAGILSIKMILENEYGVVMNHKKISRLMRKYSLETKIRRANPYRKMLKATQEHRTCPNLLKREFNQEEPGKVLLTDITYLYFGKGQKAYLSCVKDGATKEILAYYLSCSLEMDIVYQTLFQLEKSQGLFHPEAILHSDQGFHYTHPEFQERVKSLKISQSMSRRGNCWDNAPMESFFGHFKDHVNHK
ncbi:IS3 family transposase, partial [Rossellomorea sp. SC111]|uniref:IS3 family transposase n=1 Tax=Rossellomorea sp. SC111 TaxID=2968985 RepID=UPI00215A2F12